MTEPTWMPKIGTPDGSNAADVTYPFRCARHPWERYTTDEQLEREPGTGLLVCKRGNDGDRSLPMILRGKR